MNESMWVYDIETYPNIFTACFINALTGEKRQYEISERRDDSEYLKEFLKWFKVTNVKAVGFNNLGFDYPVLHDFMNGGNTYDKAQEIITSDSRFGNMIWDNEMLFPQIDLYKIHHFDNQAKRTGLKDLEIAMRSESVQDLPFPPGTCLTYDEMDELHVYNEKDVRETLAFLKESIGAINFREDLSKQYGKNFTNFSDTKIGSEIFTIELERQGVEMYYRDSNGRRAPRQTWRTSIPVREIILPYINLERPEYVTIKDLFASFNIVETKGSFADIDVTEWPEEWLCPKEEWPATFSIKTDKEGRKVASSLHVRVDGVTYFFGTGGIHAAKNNSTYHSDDEMVIEMRDVKSYYPNLSIRNNIYPEHLGAKFCAVYEELYDRRVNTPKSDPINGALKLALNGTYGNSNNQYSPFYDPKFTMSITINGQLGLCMLVEQLIRIPNLKMINVNTDGVGFIYPRKYRNLVDVICEWWEGVTKLVLEREEFKSFYQRDVNNYIGLDEHDKVVRKGAYEYKIDWHKNPSQLVVQKAVEAHLIYGADVASFILSHTDPYDFMIRAKVQRNCSLYFGDRETQRITRYFVAVNGHEIVKVTPTKAKHGTWKKARGVSDDEYDTWANMHHDTDAKRDANGVPHNPKIHTKNRAVNEDSKSRMAAGWQCVECANVSDFDWSNVNYTYYIEEAMKLIDTVR